MSRKPNYALLLRVVPLLILFVAILVLKQRCGESTAKLIDVVAPVAPAAPATAPNVDAGAAK